MTTLGEKHDLTRRLQRSNSPTRIDPLSRQEFDREQWAGADRISYEVTVTGRGEAISGPYWFGRAFDLPPFYTFSAVAVNGNQGKPVQLTVGVAEWLQDEQDMYVGVMLWFAWDACYEQLQTGIVLEENFENILERQGGGPLGNEIIAYGSMNTPEIGAKGFFWPSLNFYDTGFEETTVQLLTSFSQTIDGESFHTQIYTGDTDPLYSITQAGAPVPPESNQFIRSGWSISTANPFDGTTHLRMTQPSYDPVTQFLGGASLGSGGLRRLVPGRILPCIYPDPHQGFDIPEACANCDPDKNIVPEPFFRVSRGMTIEASCYAMVDNIDDTVNNQLFWEFSFYDENAAFIGFSLGTMDGTQQIPTSWGRHMVHTHTIEPKDPDTETVYPFNLDDIHFVRIALTHNHNPLQSHGQYTAKVWDVDKIRIRITGAPIGTDTTGSVEPIFDVNIRFQGETLKSYAVVHKLHALEAPTVVVLT